MFWPSGCDAEALKAELTGLIVAQRISHSAAAEKRIRKIYEALDGKLKLPKTGRNKKKVVDEQMRIFFR